MEQEQQAKRMQREKEILKSVQTKIERAEKEEAYKKTPQYRRERTKEFIKKYGIEMGGARTIRTKGKGGKITTTKVTREKAFVKQLGGGRIGVKKRERGTRELLKAIGAYPGQASRSGAGRPRGSYKYQIGGKLVSVFEWRKYQAQRKILYQQYQQQQQQRFAQKGFTPQQVQQLQQQQVVQEIQQPRQVPQQFQQPQQQVSPQQFARPQPTNAADDELAFRQFQIQQQVSPNTQRILDSIRRIQNKGKIDNMEQQRRHFERNLVGRSMNMMKSHENMIDTTIDFSGVKDDNILKAPSVFKENPENNILRSRGRPNILQTREAGNSLWF